MKTTFLTGVLLGLSLFGVAHAQIGGQAAADVGAGQKRAAACFACHGEEGISKIPGTPHLAGQERSYLESALRAYRDGRTRQNPTMNAMAQPLSDQDIVNIAAYFNLLNRPTDDRSVAEHIATMARLQPVAAVAVGETNAHGGSPANTADAEAPRNAATSARSGAEVYQAHCSACHAPGLAGAPRTGDQAAWQPRIAQGEAILAQHALQGLKAMPPRGACGQCSDDEIKSAVAHLMTLAE